MAQPRIPRDTTDRRAGRPHAPLARRAFLDRAMKLAGAAAGWSLLGCQPAAGDARAAFAADPTAGPASAVPPTAHGMRFQGAGEWSQVQSQAARFVTRIGAGDAASAFTHYRADVPFGPDDMAAYTAADTTWWIDPAAHWIAGDPARRSVNYNWGLFPWEFVRQQEPNPGALRKHDRVETAAKQLNALASAALGGMDAHWRLQRDNVLARFDALLPDAAKPVRLIACVGIEVTGHWYPWGTCFQGDETGRTDDHAAQFARAFRRMVRVYMERADDHHIVFAYAPTHNAFLPGDHWTNFRSLSWPGDDHVDLIMATSYDCYYAGAYMNCRHLGDRTDAERDAWYAARWHEGVLPALAGMVRFATESGRDKYLGFHEWGLFTEQTDVEDQYAPP
ncbi:MAG TPA: glycosyl hydrolase, partial [Geminicoccaceae bacterium]|nr:glycosyl hydrolase [Geminicoccaceae bacterium]